MAEEQTEEVSSEVEGDDDFEYVDTEEEEQVHNEEAEAVGLSALKEVAEKTFEEVRLPTDVLAEVQAAWATFINSAASREDAGEAIYAAIFAAAPSLQTLFKTPRSVMAMRFMNSLNSIISAASSPSALKVQVETLGFQHLEIEVTVPRVVIFRDAIIDLFDMEMGARFTAKAKLGFVALLNYVGGAYIYIKREYAVRIKVINSSWRTANNKAADFMELGQEGNGDAEGAEGTGGEEGAEVEHGNGGEDDWQNAAAKSSGDNEARASGEAKNSNQLKVPTTFNEMFMFNGAVMGFGSSTWMTLILEQFDNIVTNVANSSRLQEECDVLSLVLAKYRGNIVLAEFKAVMLASLRSLVPKEWDSNHEIAWGWLWENVERMLKALMGKPQEQEKALELLIMSLTEDAVNFLRREIFKHFFALAPAGQDYHKASTTRLYWITDKIVEMTIEMYREPKQMVEEISALGLRHVGYAIPTEFFGPFVQGAVEVIRLLTANELAEEAFRWSLTLISKVLVRTILEGSTIVMKAINTNQEKALKKAISVSPRGGRAMELLNITVGTQSISPLFWAIESGSLNSAKAMVEDLLTIRADRDNYYYGCDDLFTRHPEIIQRLCVDAGQLLTPLLDGLIWRSRLAINGQRRVNYYVKHLVQDSDGGFNQALEWLSDYKDPKIICHPVVVLFSDLIWSNLANRYFFLGRCFFLFQLVVFVCSQALIPRLTSGPETEGERIAIFACRIIVYMGSLGYLIKNQVALLVTDMKAADYKRVLGVPLPQYLMDSQQLGSLVLLVLLVVMLASEPIIRCISEMDGNYEGSGLFTTRCPEALKTKKLYTVCSMMAMLLYWALLTDLSVFSMRISAFVLVCGRVFSEVALFIGALFFLVITFASAISALNHSQKDFGGIEKGWLSLTEMALNMYPTENFTVLHVDAMVFIACALFLVISLIFLQNLLIAQLNGAYAEVYEDMVGYARLNRGDVIVASVNGASAKRWNKFLLSLKFEENLEFNEGDIGVKGGVQILEPSYANPTTVDAIRRFGGSTSPAMPWPEEESAGNNEEENKFERLEKLIARATRSIGDGGRKRGKGSSSLGQTSSQSGSAQGGEDDEGSD